MAHLSPSRSRYSLSQFNRSFRRFVWQWLEFPSVQPILRYAAVSKRWLVGGALLLVLLLWNWQLVISLGLGLLTLAIGYLLQQGQGKRLWAACQQGWQSIDRPFVLTVASSLLVIGISYLTLAIWQEMESAWLAIGFLFEGAGILAGLGLLGWLVWRYQDESQNSAAIGGATDAQWLKDLADVDPLKRLLAVRQLTHTVTQAQSTVLLTSEELAESFRLMLNRETEPIVCRALLESLQRLDARTPALSASRQPEMQTTTRINSPVEWEEL